MVDNVKRLDHLDNARTIVKNQIQHMYKNGAPPKEQELTLETSAEKLLSGREKLPAGRGKHDHVKRSVRHAVETTRDELANVFRKLEDELSKNRSKISGDFRADRRHGGSHARINLGDER